MKKHYIFDFDGTLFDSMPYWASSMIKLLDSYNISYPADVIKRITPLGYQGTARYFHELGLQMEHEQIIRAMEANAYPAYRDVIELKDGVREYLEYLRSKGCRLHVLTASPHLMVDVCLKRNGVYDWFDNVWTCDDFALAKFNPQIYRNAMARLDAEMDEGVFFDDNIHSVQTAMEAGLLAVGCFDESGKTFEEELKSSADRYVYSFKELMDVEL